MKQQDYSDVDAQAQREFIGSGVTYTAVCWECRGSGHYVDGRTCKNCGGKGWYLLTIAPHQRKRPTPRAADGLRRR